MKKKQERPVGYLQYLEWVKGPGGAFIEKSARNFRKQWERDKKQGERQ